jgi:hypothetical protein
MINVKGNDLSTLIVRSVSPETGCYAGNHPQYINRTYVYVPLKNHMQVCRLLLVFYFYPYP